MQADKEGKRRSFASQNRSLAPSPAAAAAAAAAATLALPLRHRALQGSEGRVNDLEMCSLPVGNPWSSSSQFIGMCSLTSKLESSSAMVVLGRRRFLNLIVAGCSPGVKSLRRINLAQLFYRATPPPPSKMSTMTTTDMETFHLPRPNFTLRALNIEWKLNCFPFAGRKVICGDDQSGIGFMVDVESRKMETIPPLLKSMPKVNPVSIFVHKPHVDDDIFSDGNGSSLFLMERVPHPEPISNGVKESEQFVGFINHYPSGPAGGDKSLTYRRLPPPPFVRETWSWYNNTPEITAYGVVGDGSHVCISVEGVGTYCFDTASHTWSQVGKWTLPFHGNLEYVPELKLWFGLSGDSRHLAAADLSDMDSQPRPLVVGGPWKELVPPDEWKECKDPQFVSLGSGRFCIARFFQEAAGKVVAVLTGLEVNTSGEGDTGKVELQMAPHRSRRVNNTSIETLF